MTAEVFQVDDNSLQRMVEIGLPDGVRKGSPLLGTTPPPYRVGAVACPSPGAARGGWINRRNNR